MALILANIIFDTKRSNYTAGQGTSIPVPYLFDIDGHIQPAAARHLSVNTVAAVKIGYTVRIDPELDVVVGDYVYNIRLKKTGQLWVSNAGDGAQIWNVIDALEATPGPVSYRLVVVTRAIFGGPVPL
jgi:hypothetical protein